MIADKIVILKAAKEFCPAHDLCAQHPPGAADHRARGGWSSSRLHPAGAAVPAHITRRHARLCGSHPGDFEAYIADVQEYFRCLDDERARTFTEAREVSDDYATFLNAVE